MRRLVSCFIFLCALGASASDAVSPAQDAFQIGLQEFQKGLVEEAAKNFQKSLDLQPDNPNTLYNWGLTQLQLGKAGTAAAAWRKALFLDPDFSPAKKGLVFLQDKLATAPFARRTGTWETFRALVLNVISIHQALGAGLVFLIPAGFLLLRYWGRRRTALGTETPMPPFPSVGFGFAVLFLAFVGLAAAKAFDHLVPRATIVTDKTELRTGPSEQDNSLLALSEGLEVIVKKSTGDWAQITFPGGATGWVPKANLFHTSGRSPW